MFAVESSIVVIEGNIDIFFASEVDANRARFVAATEFRAHRALGDWLEDVQECTSGVLENIDDLRRYDQLVSGGVQLALSKVASYTASVDMWESLIAWAEKKGRGR